MTIKSKRRRRRSRRSPRRSPSRRRRSRSRSRRRSRSRSPSRRRRSRCRGRSRHCGGAKSRQSAGFHDRRATNFRARGKEEDREARNLAIWRRTQGKRIREKSAKNKLRSWARKRLSDRRLQNQVKEYETILEASQALENLAPYFSHGRPGLEALIEFPSEPVIVPGEVVLVEHRPRPRGVFVHGATG